MDLQKNGFYKTNKYPLDLGEVSKKILRYCSLRSPRCGNTSNGRSLSKAIEFSSYNNKADMIGQYISSYIPQAKKLMYSKNIDFLGIFSTCKLGKMEFTGLSAFTHFTFKTDSRTYLSIFRYHFATVRFHLLIRLWIVMETESSTDDTISSGAFEPRTTTRVWNLLSKYEDFWTPCLKTKLTNTAQLTWKIAPDFIHQQPLLYWLRICFRPVKLYIDEYWSITWVGCSVVLHK